MTYKKIIIRKAALIDLEAIMEIYNQGIEDRIATLELETKDVAYMERWFKDRGGRYAVIVAERDSKIVGWASLNRFSQRSAYDGVADLSIYINRNQRGKGIGSILLMELEKLAKENGFYKIVLSTFAFNGLGQGLYRKLDYREVGVFEKQGLLDGELVDIMIMEKLL